MTTLDHGRPARMLAVTNLSVRFGGLIAIEDLTLEVNEGEV